jgi:uncharacterized protein (TIGR04255 family)
MGALYKNAPLVNTAFESRFFGNLSIEAHRYQFQNAIQNEFPKLYVPNAALNVSPALQHYQFRNNDNTSRLSLAINSFVYATSHYPGFEVFHADLERHRTTFNDIFEIRSFTRLGLRYTNQLPIIRDEDNTIPLSKYVTARFNLAGGFPSDRINEVQFNMSCKMTGGDLRVLIQSEVRSGLEVLTVDFDFSQQGEIKNEQIPDFLISAHEQIESVFLGMISDDYKEIMKGV